MRYHFSTQHSIYRRLWHSKGLISKSEAFDAARWILRRGPSSRINRAVFDRGQLRKPLAYILGETDFHGMRNFKVREPVLIPRPETEWLVEQIVDTVSPPPDRFIDLCTGSGAIAIALLRAWPTSRAVAIDVSDIACALAEENAKKFKVYDRLRIVHKSIEEFAKQEFSIGDRFLSTDSSPVLVVSNPPYIPSRRIRELQPEIRDWEDHRALDGGEDGMDWIRQIFKYFGSHELWLEIDAESNQAQKIKDEFGVEALKDQFGADRFVRRVKYSPTLI